MSFKSDNISMLHELRVQKPFTEIFGVSAISPTEFFRLFKAILCIHYLLAATPEGGWGSIS